MADDSTSSDSTSSSSSSKKALAVGDRVTTADGTEYVVMSVVADAHTLHKDANDPQSATYTEAGAVLMPASLLSHPQPVSTLSRVGQ